MTQFNTENIPDVARVVSYVAFTGTWSAHITSRLVPFHLASPPLYYQIWTMHSLETLNPASSPVLSRCKFALVFPLPVNSFLHSFPSPPLPLSSAGRPSVWGGMWACYVENYVIATKKRVSKEKDSQCMLLLIVTVLCSANGNKMERQAIAIVILN